MKNKNQQVTVLGGSGYIGSHLSDLLTQKGFYVKIFDIKKSKYLKHNQKMYLGNLLQKKKLNESIKRSKYVFNFAALSNIDIASDQPFKTAKINILGTINILEACKKNKVKKLIHASSIYANSEQGGFYGCSKKASEDYIERFQQRYNTKFTILRFGSLYGGRSNNDNGLQRLINSAKRKKKITYAGSRGSERRYIHVKDAVNMCVKSMKKKFDNKYLTLTGKNKIRITSVIRLIQKQFKIKDKDINFQNIKNNIHYVNEPKDYIPRKGINIAIGSRETFVHNLKNLILKKS